MNQLLLEIGLEELPASFMNRALKALPELLHKALEDLRIEHGEIRALGTPRRISAFVNDLASRQSDLSETVLGPPRAAAFNDDGTPKKAAMGFARKFGLDVSALTIQTTAKGDYVAAHREEKGKPTQEILGAALSRVCPQIPFPKSMRWGVGDIAFGRPVHWIVALLDHDVVDFEFAHTRSGRKTRGHRFLAPAEFELGHAKDYLAALDAAHVTADPTVREERMMRALQGAAKQTDATLVEDAFLVFENAAMVEEAHVVIGCFDEAFLSLPDEVTIEVMRGHQRYFALRNADGSLKNNYLAVVNTDRAHHEIQRGNDRVLRARLADARFFVDEDQKRTLSERVVDLDQVVFQAKLGTLGERVTRLQHIVKDLGDTGAGVEAARLCKADLVTLIIGEFPELQGMMGRWYALRQGVEPEIADAIQDHYAPRGASDALPTAPTSARLAVADRADVLVGCFSIGLIPSGSADPFALRRAALGIIRIALEGPIDVDLNATLQSAWHAYAAQEKPVGELAAVHQKLEAFFKARLRVLYSARYDTDLVDACLAAWQGGSIRDLDLRMKALEAFRAMPAYESLAIAFKRAHNIAKDAPEGEYSPEKLEAGAEADLAKAFATLKPKVAQAVDNRAYGEALSTIAAELRAPIDRYFEEVFVMVDDEALRANRLRLLRDISNTLTAIAHFHLLSA